MRKQPKLWRVLHLRETKKYIFHSWEEEVSVSFHACALCNAITCLCVPTCTQEVKPSLVHVKHAPYSLPSLNESVLHQLPLNFLKPSLKVIHYLTFHTHPFPLLIHYIFIEHFIFSWTFEISYFLPVNLFLVNYIFHIWMKKIWSFTFLLPTLNSI